jgi:hypothetical protein
MLSMALNMFQPSSALVLSLQNLVSFPALRLRSFCNSTRPMRTRIVTVGDVHGQWDAKDEQALHCLEPGACAASTWR